MKNPYVFWGLAIIAFIGGIFIGNSDWFKNLFVTTKQSPPRPTSEGKACTTTTGKPGVIKGGVCIAIGDKPIDSNLIERVAPNNNNNPDNNYSATNSDQTTSRTSNSASLTSEQQDAYGRIKSGEVNFPIACTTWAEMVVGGASHSALDAQWKLCSAALSKTTQGSNPNAPNDLFLPLNQSCQKYTMLNPYVYLGCKYVFAGIVLKNGKRVCRLRRAAC